MLIFQRISKKGKERMNRAESLNRRLFVVLLLTLIVAVVGCKEAGQGGAKKEENRVSDDPGPSLLAEHATRRRG